MSSARHPDPRVSSRAARLAPGTLLLLGLGASPVALADGTAVWLSGGVDPTVVGADSHLTVEQVVVDASWSKADEDARALLAAELEAVRPLLDVFDGELQILRRLDVALDGVSAVQDQDRALLHGARAFQGLAVERYFQDDLATEPEAAAWRVDIPGPAGSSAVLNRAYADAIAIDPDTLPSADLVPDDDARVSYQDVRARLLVAPDATVVATDLPDGGSLVVDGRASPSDRARVIPGEHRLAIVVDGVIRSRVTARLSPGDTLTVPTPASADELRALADTLDGSSAIVLPPRIATSLATLDGPVSLVVGDRKSPLVYRVDSGAAVPMQTSSEQPTTRTRGARSSDDPWLVRVGLSQAWVYDGEWYLQNLGDGAEEARSTVNGTTPGLHLGVEKRFGLLAVGAGADARWTFGKWQVLHVGDADMRLRAYPHVAVGIPWVQATVGAWLPWRLGLGARAHLPLAGPLELTAGGLYGLGPTYARDDGDDFTPAGSWSAWGGLSARFGD